MVITGLTRNQFASNRTWVRIPSSPPTKPLEMYHFQGFFLSCFSNRLHEHVFAIGVINECPAISLGVLLQSALFEVFESAVFAYREQFTVPHIPCDGLGLHVHPADKIHLGDHAFGFFLRIKYVHQLILKILLLHSDHMSKKSIVARQPAFFIETKEPIAL